MKLELLAIANTAFTESNARVRKTPLPCHQVFAITHHHIAWQRSDTVHTAYISLA